MSKKRPNPNIAVEDFYNNYAIGQQVRVTKDDGSVLETVTTSDPWVLGGHTAVIMLEAISGCYALDRVKPY